MTKKVASTDKTEKKAPRKRGRRQTRVAVAIIETPAVEGTSPAPLSAQDEAAAAEVAALKAKGLTLFEDRPNISHVCRELGISRQTWYTWRALDDAFAQAEKDAMERGLDNLEEAMLKRGEASDTTAGIFMLKSWRPDRYRETVKLDIVSPQVVDRLTRTYAIVSHAVSPDVWKLIEPQLDEVWQ